MIRESKIRLLMVTAVWGEWHLSMHFDVNLPTLLADGNLPALARHCRVTYLLFTQKSDLPRLEAAPAMKALRALMDVEIEVLDQEDLANPIAAHHKAWNLAMRRAKAEGRFLLLMPPDVAWSENAFRSVGERLAEGRKAIFMTYMRAVSDSFVASLAARREPGSLALGIPARDMVLLCMRSLHPLMAAYLRNSEFFPHHAEMILWTIPGEGVLARVLAREMFLFDPSYFTLNQASLPADKIDPADAYCMSDSDELFAVSLAPLGKDAAWHVYPRIADPVEIGGWWLTYDSPVNDFVVQHKLRWHYEPLTEAKWRGRERGADLFLRRTAIVREGIRLWQAARQLGCAAVAPIVALSIHTGALARAARGRGGALVLLPTDAALEREPPEEIERLMTPAGTRALTAVLRQHYVPNFEGRAAGGDPLETLLSGRPEVELTAASGANLRIRWTGGAPSVNGARVAGAPVVAGGHVVYPIDRVLVNLNQVLDSRRPEVAEPVPARARASI